MTVARVDEDLSGWGRFPTHRTNATWPGDVATSAAAADDAAQAVARGNGRAYGDAAVGAVQTVHTGRLDRFIDFDGATGILTCEAGVMLADVIDMLLPRGWIVPVTPGTRYVTIGGMIAADVHGKNHHVAGSFTDHVEWIDLTTGDGIIRRCSQHDHADLFAATCGGMGLTGIILRAAVRMKPVATNRIRQRTIRAPDLTSALAAFEDNLAWTYSVAWVDCLAQGERLGRSVIFLGEHAGIDELPVEERGNPYRRTGRRQGGVPFDLPSAMLSTRIVRAFNKLYYAVQRPGDALVPLEPYFYPLDAIADWNRIYGRRGFVQYQCVIPLDASEQGLRALLSAIAAAGTGSFLAVLKRMGPASFGLLSFPREGYTLALDFPVDDANLALLDRLDRITADHGGRIYLAKDARAKPSFAAGYERMDQFRKVRAGHRLADRFVSRLSQRLEI